MDGTREQFHSEFKTDLDLERLYPKGLAEFARRQRRQRLRSPQASLS